jgi:hypothetical protein
VNLYGSIPLEGTTNVYTVVSEFFNLHRNSTIFANVPTDDFIKLLKLTNTFDSVNILGKNYRQTHGVAMGNNLSPLLAIIFMEKIERNLKTLPNILYWRRYIDDIFAVSTSPLNSLLPEINLINNNIQFTLENPNERGVLPFLDTQVLLNNGIWEFDLYVKPTHSGYIMPWISHVPKQQKISLLKTERLRLSRICSTKDSFDNSIKRMKNKFIQNGYPTTVVDKHLVHYNNSSDRNNNKNRPLNKVYLRFPYVNEAFSNKIRTCVRQADLPLTIIPIFVTNPPLKSILKKQSKSTCGQHCLCGNKGLCYTKNVVYQIKCTLCGDHYIGETMRTLRKRLAEHMASYSYSMVFEHFNQHHHILPMAKYMEVKILQRNFHNTLERLQAEKNFIETCKPSINTIYNS